MRVLRIACRWLASLLIVLFPLLLCGATTPPAPGKAGACYWLIEQGPVSTDQCFQIRVHYVSGHTETVSCGDYLPVECNAQYYRVGQTIPGAGVFRMKLKKPGCASPIYDYGLVAATNGCGDDGDCLSFAIVLTAGGSVGGAPTCGGGTCPECDQNPLPCVNGQCPNGQTCVNGVCLQNCGAGQGACPNGQVCQNGVCGAPCANPCPNGQVCQNGACVAGCNPACPVGKVCLDGTCKNQPGCSHGGEACTNPNGDCDADGVRNGCDPDCRDCEAVNGCCVDCGGDCKPKCSDPGCSVANNSGCTDADADGCCDNCGPCDCTSPRFPNCCKNDPSNPLYPDCKCTGSCKCDQNNYPACCLNDPENPAYPECPPCSGCQNCNPCKRLDTIIGLLSGSVPGMGGGSVPEPNIQKTPDPEHTLLAINPGAVSSYNTGSIPASDHFQFVMPIPGHSPWEITFGARPSQWAFNGHGLHTGVATALEVVRVGFRAIAGLFISWRLAFKVVELLFKL